MRGRTRRPTVVSWASLLVVGVCGCVPGVVACPAIGYSSSLTLELPRSEALPAEPGIELTCPDDPFCVAEQTVAPDGSVHAVLSSSPAHLTATVTDDGVLVAEVPVLPTWRVVERPHGPRCGGPVAAHVVLELPG